MAKKILTRDLILAAEDLPIIEENIPEWGGTVYLQGMTAAARDDFEQAITSQVGKDIKVDRDNIRAKMVAAHLVDSEGVRLFRQADVEALGRKSAAVLDKLFGTAMELSGITEKDLDEMAENLKVGQPDDSSLD